MAKVKDKERILKAARKKQKTETHTREPPEVYQLIFQQKLCRPEGSGMIYLMCLKGKKLQTRILYPARLLFSIEGEIKSFSDKQKIKVHNTEPTL